MNPRAVFSVFAFAASLTGSATASATTRELIATATDAPTGTACGLLSSAWVSRFAVERVVSGSPTPDHVYVISPCGMATDDSGPIRPGDRYRLALSLSPPPNAPSFIEDHLGEPSAPRYWATQSLNLDAVTQNIISVQFSPALHLRVNPAGKIVVADGIQLTRSQAHDLREIQSLAGVKWQSEIDPSTVAALQKNRPGENGAEVEKSLNELSSFARATVGVSPRRGRKVHAGTPLDDLPAMSAAESAQVAEHLAHLRTLGIVSRAYLAPLPAPPP